MHYEKHPFRKQFTILSRAIQRHGAFQGLGMNTSVISLAGVLVNGRHVKLACYGYTDQLALGNPHSHRPVSNA